MTRPQPSEEKSCPMDCSADCRRQKRNSLGQASRRNASRPEIENRAIHFSKGTIIHFRAAGGGGYGPPGERTLAAIQSDLDDDGHRPDVAREATTPGVSVNRDPAGPRDRGWRCRASLERRNEFNRCRYHPGRIAFGTFKLPDPVAFVAARAEERTSGRLTAASWSNLVLRSGPMMIGHAHPHVVAAIQEQTVRGTTFYAMNDVAPRLAARIAEIVPCARR